MELDLKQSTVVVLAVMPGQARIYSDLNDMKILVVLKAAFEYLRTSPPLQTIKDPEVGVVDIIFDAKGRVFLHTNMSLPKTRSVVARFLKELLEETDHSSALTPSRSALKPFVKFRPRSH